MSPVLTANPAKSIVASLGIGMQALSRSMSTKTAGSPHWPMSAVAHCTTMSMMDCILSSVPYRAAPGHAGLPHVGRVRGLW